ncbi:MAG: decaprenyl-phosphate phosphoribosyltransferase [bacterium]|nr:decaprenyl-phosphate phosphoribosyltransferase [bacterium]
MILPLLRSIRPRHWVKNAVVLAAVMFSEHLLDVDYLLRSLAAAGVFVLLSSAVYLINDLADIDADRLHPDKASRPIASGDLPRSVAITAAIALLMGGLSSAKLLHADFALVALVYVALNLAYSLGLKRAALVDILMVATGFLLRAVGGAIVIEVDISTWFIACTFTLTLFLAAAKRRGELVRLDADAPLHRVSLGAYDVGFLDQIMSVLASATLLCYALYAMGVGEGGITASRQMQWTIPFVLYGVLRYMYLVHRGVGDDPTALLWRDRALQVNLLLWGAVSMGLVYGAH